MTYEYIFRGKQPHKGALSRTQGGVLLVAVPRYTPVNGFGASSIITIDQIAREFDLREIIGTFGAHTVEGTVIVNTRCAHEDGEIKRPILDPKHFLPFEQLLLQSYNGTKIRYI